MSESTRTAYVIRVLFDSAKSGKEGIVDLGFKKEFSLALLLTL